MKNLKVLLVCVHFHSSFGWSIEQALKRLGHQVRVFDYRNPPPPFQLGYRRLWSEHVMPRKLIQAARAFRPDLVLIGKGEAIRGETLQQIRSELQCRIVNWFPDSRLFSYDHVVAQLPSLDGLFSKSMLDVNRVRLMGLSNAHFLPHCADRELHTDLQASEDDLKPYRCEVSLVGASYPYRDRILQPLCEFDLKVWGRGWKKSSIYHQKPEAVTGQEARSLEQAKVFRATSVNINIHHYDDVDQLNQRVFDIAGSGGCQVSDGSREYGPIFDKSADILIYESAEELKSSVRYLLDKPALREEMGARCRRKIAANHTYDHRVLEIIDVLRF